MTRDPTRRCGAWSRPSTQGTRPGLTVTSSKRPSASVPDRPNPVGLHQVRILAIDGTRIRVSDLEAIDGTPVLDIKPVLAASTDR